ncbi:MAG: hypothetical protein EA382_15360 [Spirochaetaceae bacterium]|nr:MAG: hypothetical protein EA382_15360 [Spirochaetaceae bacterium]
MQHRDRGASDCRRTTEANGHRTVAEGGPVKPVRPNIVWIVLDHLILHSRIHGSAYPRLSTIDRLATEGVEFTRALSVCPICTPARASMLSGVYPHRHGLLQNTGAAIGRSDFLPSTPLYNTRLADVGYRCAYFGKWHCGDRLVAADYGFDGWSDRDYGYPYALREYAEYLNRNQLPDPEVDLEWHYSAANPVGRVPLRPGFKGPRAHMAAGVLVSPERTHETRFVVESACDWIHEHAAGEDPFCIRVDPWGPHHPYFVPEERAGTIDPATLDPYPSFGHSLADRPRHHREYRDEIHGSVPFRGWNEWAWLVARAYEHAEYADATIGWVIDSLDAIGIADQTVVIVTADHGDALASNGGLIDKDSMMVEETMRIPLVIRAPDFAEPGSVCAVPVTNMDIVPTLYRIAGADVDDRCDGTDLLAIASGAAHRDHVMCEHHGHTIDAYQRYIRAGDLVYVAHNGDSDELYDLASDPYQLANRIDDAAMSSTLVEMQRRLASEMHQFGDTQSPYATALLNRLGHR